MSTYFRPWTEAELAAWEREGGRGTAASHGRSSLERLEEPERRHYGQEATCHPGERHYARGLCKTCYDRSRPGRHEPGTPRAVVETPLAVPAEVPPGHGTVKGYVDGCRCLPCTAAAQPFLQAQGLTHLDPPA